MATPPLILVVDDEPHIVHVLSVKLRKAGFDVLCAMDGQAALASALEHSPDLVITDYQMPLLNGGGLCDALLHNKTTRDTPVVMLTARTHSIGEHDSHRSNIKAVIGKPFSPREVLKKVHELLGTTPGWEAAKAS